MDSIKNQLFYKIFPVADFETTVRAPLLAAACIFFTPFLVWFINQERLILQTIYELNKEIWA